MHRMLFMKRGRHSDVSLCCDRVALEDAFLLFERKLLVKVSHDSKVVPAAIKEAKG
jgi:hypothetical protein